jgi:4-carboxymuconolactone decarboxylase
VERPKELAGRGHGDHGLREPTITPDAAERLRGIAMHDEGSIRAALGLQPVDRSASGLDARTYTLVRLAALHGVKGAPASYQCLVSEALAAGASVDEIVGTLAAVAPLVGVARAVAAAPELALALGYDVDAALEVLEPTTTERD